MALAKKRLSAVAEMVERGYGQVEPNHIAAQRTGRIKAQLPLDKDVEVLENGVYAYYNEELGVVSIKEKVGEPYLVYNEIHTYEVRATEADYAMKQEDFTHGIYNAQGAYMPEGTAATPRLFAIEIGDTYTTNCVKDATVALGAILKIGADGYLSTGGAAGYEFKVVKLTTTPDGQKAVKVTRVK